MPEAPKPEAPKLNDVIPGLDPNDEHELCPTCGEAYGYPCCELFDEWETCYECGGDGFFELYDEDPLYYARGETEPCHFCGGQGGWSRQWCPGGCRQGEPHGRPKHRAP